MTQKQRKSVLIDLRNKGITGKEADAALIAADITVNKNMVPYDDKSPMVTSGIRIGTAALTTRGMKQDEMKKVGAWILRVLKAPDDAAVTEAVKHEIREFAKSFPVPGIG